MIKALFTVIRLPIFRLGITETTFLNLLKAAKTNNVNIIGMYGTVEV